MGQEKAAEPLFAEQLHCHLRDLIYIERHTSVTLHMFPKSQDAKKALFTKISTESSCREMGLRRTMDSLTFKLFSYFDLVDTELFCGTMNSSFLVIIHPRSEKDWSYFLTLLCQCFLIDPRLCSFVNESTQTLGPSGEAPPINSHEQFSLRQRKLGFWAAKIIYKTEAREEKGTQL